VFLYRRRFWGTPQLSGVRHFLNIQNKMKYKILFTGLFDAGILSLKMLEIFFTLCEMVPQ